ncbi:hypothetical protein RRG08_043956 [Elysia crispata]|uniref:Uncharacterized protein n=1 Tax=Elysia crispata TaxID=231223 RepID=A0AAE1CQW4_9GAST|nr:hypothetical protein RRG08_043956 [Elysia crispata]
MAAETMTVCGRDVQNNLLILALARRRTRRRFSHHFARLYSPSALEDVGQTSLLSVSCSPPPSLPWAGPTYPPIYSLTSAPVRLVYSMPVFPRNALQLPKRSSSILDAFFKYMLCFLQGALSNSKMRTSAAPLVLKVVLLANLLKQFLSWFTRALNKEDLHRPEIIKDREGSADQVMHACREHIVQHAGFDLHHIQQTSGRCVWTTGYNSALAFASSVLLDGGKSRDLLPQCSIIITFAIASHNEVNEHRRHLADCGDDGGGKHRASGVTPRISLHSPTGLSLHFIQHQYEKGRVGQEICWY